MERCIKYLPLIFRSTDETDLEEIKTRSLGNWPRTNKNSDGVDVLPGDRTNGTSVSISQATSKNLSFLLGGARNNSRLGYVFKKAVLNVYSRNFLLLS